MKSFTRKKLLALFAAASLAVAFTGTAFAAAANVNSLTLNGTMNNAPFGLGSNRTAATAGQYNFISGFGTQAGSVTNVEVNPLILNLKAASTNTLLIAPAATSVITGIDTVAGDNNSIQMYINDGATDNGTVLIRASNGDNPTAAALTQYDGGTFVVGGTLGITNNNSLGQNWVALVGRTIAETRAGATLQTSGSTVVSLGATDPAGDTTVQPLYLTHTTPNGIKLATINVGNTAGVLQTLNLLQGVGEGEFVAPTAGGVGALQDDHAVLTPFDVTTGADYLRTGFLAADDRAGRLVKTGAGTLIVTEYVANASTTHPTIRGMAHTGGTVVNAGTLQVDGYNANTYVDHFTGFVGSMWSLYAPTQDYLPLMDGGGRVPNYFANTPDEIGNNNNPFTLNGGNVIVNRAQMFSDFNTAAGTTFTANEYTLDNVNYRPVVNVMLMRRPSTAAGKLGGSFDLVLNSIRNDADDSRNLQEAQSPNYVDDVIGNGQATLTVSNPDNAIHGQTFVNNGVLAIGGAKSIGTGNLTVGAASAVRGITTPDDGKAVFLGLANATFTNKTYVNGPAMPIKPTANGPAIIGLGALAAATGTTVAYADVTVTGAMEINPQAVGEAILDGASGAVNWMNGALYPTWGGTVAFGGENNTYTLNGNVNLPTQVIVSRGNWKLNSYPADNGFAQVTLRETATLILAKGVSDFSNRFDVQVDDDSRIRVTPAASDVVNSRAAAAAKPALFSVRTIDTTWLGSGPENKDRRLAVQLDLSEAGALQKGQWIKVIEADDAVKWNNIHYLRDNSSTFYEDYAKVRPGLINNADLSTQVIAHVDENPYVVYLEVLEAVDPGTPSSTNFTFASDSTSVATNAAISGTVTLKDNSGAAVASEDVTFYLFHTGVNTSDNANAIEGPVTVKTDDNGVAAYLFNKGNYGNAAGYIIKAEAAGYSSAMKTVTTTGGSYSSSSSSGCDAGFGAFALLALAGSALVLRKKD